MIHSRRCEALGNVTSGWMLRIGTAAAFCCYRRRLNGTTTAELLDCTDPGRVASVSKQNATGCLKNQLR